MTYESDLRHRPVLTEDNYKSSLWLTIITHTLNRRLTVASLQLLPRQWTLVLLFIIFTLFVFQDHWRIYWFELDGSFAHFLV